MIDKEEVGMMCEADAYIIDEDGNETLLMEGVDRLSPEDGQMVLESIFGEQKRIKAKIKEMALVEHRIVLERIK